MKSFMGIDVDSIAHRCAEQIAKHDHKMSSPEIEGILKGIELHLDRIATQLETPVPGRKPHR
jgi:hypothetical protein